MNLEIEKHLIKLIAEKVDLSPDDLPVGARVEDLGIDSLGAADLLFKIEEHYGVNMAESYALSDRFELGTVTDLVNRVENMMC